MPSSYIPPWRYRASNPPKNNLVSGEVLKHTLQGRELNPSRLPRLSSLIFLNSLPDNDLESAALAIVVIHDSVGASNPVATVACRTVLERRLRPETPRSWSNEDKQLFASLPVEIRAILTRRENQRDNALRRGQDKIAAEIKRLNAPAEAEPKKETENEQK